MQREERKCVTGPCKKSSCANAYIRHEENCVLQQSQDTKNNASAMVNVVSFTFNAFQENTWIVIDRESQECVIFDPGCSDRHEQETLKAFVEENAVHPVRLINTHCHIDHVLGNRFVAETWGLSLEIHKGEIPVLASCEMVAGMYSIPYDPSPEPGGFIEAGQELSVGDTVFRALLTPGHSPASLSFFFPDDKAVIAGDVLFHGSIGRTDLPGGDYDTLIRSIREQLYPLGDEVRVYPGHGSSTTIGYERLTNPFVKDA